jgi:hypothetical protein
MLMHEYDPAPPPGSQHMGRPMIYSPDRGWARIAAEPMSLAALRPEQLSRILIHEGPDRILLFDSVSFVVTPVVAPAPLTAAVADRARARLFYATRGPDGDRLFCADGAPLPVGEITLPAGLRISDLAISPNGQRLLISGGGRFLFVDLPEGSGVPRTVDVPLSVRGFEGVFLTDNIWLMIPEGGQDIAFLHGIAGELVGTVASAWRPKPSVSGRYLYVTRDLATGAGEILEVAENPFSVRSGLSPVLFPRAIFPREPVWSEDDRYLLFAATSLGEIGKRAILYCYAYDVAERALIMLYQDRTTMRDRRYYLERPLYYESPAAARGAGGRAS